MTCQGMLADVQAACKRLGEDRRPRKELADLPKRIGKKYKGLANVMKCAGRFAKGLHPSPRTPADLQRACMSHDKFWHPRKRLARNLTEVLSIARGLREPQNENGI